MRFEAYLHTNGKIQCKRLTPFGSFIDTSSSFVDKYLGEVEAETIAIAKQIFTNSYIEY